MLRSVHSISVVSLPDTQTAKVSQRLVAIDMLRGIAMLLMALDHSSFFAQFDVTAETYNGIRPELGSWAQVVTGLITNLASNIFFTLAGVSVAFFEESRRKRGWSEWMITRFLVTRAVVLLVLDQIVSRYAWHSPVKFDVLSAIAFSVIALAFARRLPLRILAILAVVLFAIYPLLVVLFPYNADQPFSVLFAILFQHSSSAPPMVEFPAVARLSLMLGGYVWGRLLRSGRTSISPRLLWVAFAGFALWFVLRMLHTYGDFFPFTPDMPWYYFFIENKQPPSITFFLLNLSAALVILVGLNRVEKVLQRSFLGWGLTVLGQTSLFFYVAHLLLYSRVVSRIFIDAPTTGILRAYAEFALGIAILLPVCAGYRILRRRYSILSYL